MPEPVPPLLVRAMGVTVAIAVPDELTRDRLVHQWSRALVAPGGTPVATVDYSTANTAKSHSLDYGVTTQVTLAALEATVGERINLHAGGVADSDGRLLALVAPSGTGKTTATITLAQRLGYVSDETISISPDGTVLPYAKPLSVIVDQRRPRDKEQVSPDDLGLLPTPDEARLERLVLLHRGSDRPRGLRHLARAEALLQLIEQSSSLAELPRPLHALLRLVDECQGVWEMSYDEIADHADELVALLRGVPSEPYPPQQLTWHDGSRQAGFQIDLEGPLVARCPWVEAVEIDDQLVVLTMRKAWLLSGLTSTLWLCLDEHRSLNELVEMAEDVHGSHDEARARVVETIGTLAEAQVLAYGRLA